MSMVRVTNLWKTIAVLSVLGLMLGFFVFTAYAETPEEQRTRLEQELVQYEKEIAEKEKILFAQKQQTGSLQRDVSILTNQIAAAKLKIKARTTAIAKLTIDINKHNQKILTLQE
jgi:septal ring factor EnvC (AmiA/AmiB activator)